MRKNSRQSWLIAVSALYTVLFTMYTSGASFSKATAVPPRSYINVAEDVDGGWRRLDANGGNRVEDLVEDHPDVPGLVRDALAADQLGGAVRGGDVPESAHHILRDDDVVGGFEIDSALDAVGCQNSAALKIADFGSYSRAHGQSTRVVRVVGHYTFRKGVRMIFSTWLGCGPRLRCHAWIFARRSSGN